MPKFEDIKREGWLAKILGKKWGEGGRESKRGIPMVSRFPSSYMRGAGPQFVDRPPSRFRISVVSVGNESCTLSSPSSYVSSISLNWSRRGSTSAFVKHQVTINLHNVSSLRLFSCPLINKLTATPMFPTSGASHQSRTQVANHIRLPIHLPRFFPQYLDRNPVLSHLPS